jgi:hypothetical protein
VVDQRLVLSFLLSVLLDQPIARADQPRDWVLQGVRAGDRLYLDFFGTGMQATLEHRGPIYGDSNAYAFSITPLASYPVSQVQGTASLRILFFELSGTVGYRSVFRNLSFEPGDDGAYCKACDRAARRDRDPFFGGGTTGTDAYPYAEGDVAMYGPLNDNLVFATVFGVRYEDGHPRSFDYFLTDIHDPGVILISETTLFLKHRDWGGIGPYFQVLSLPRAGQHDTEIAWGFNAVARLGLLKRNDAVFVSLLMRPDDKYYGQHGYYLPARALINYRMAFEL